MQKWFHPEHKSGFKKERTIEENYQEMLSNADHRMNLHDRRIRVGKQALSLANVTQDPATKKKAKAVSKKAFGMI